MIETIYACRWRAMLSSYHLIFGYANDAGGNQPRTLWSLGFASQLRPSSFSTLGGFVPNVLIVVVSY